MEEFVGPKMYSYPTYYGKKAEFTKRCIIKLKIKFAYFKNCMENNKTYRNLGKVLAVKFTMYSQKKLTRLTLSAILFPNNIVTKN